GAVRGDHLIFSAYGHTLGFERACLIWRDGDGWHRSEDATADTWSSEGAPVVLPDGTVRLFYRDGFERVRYTDYAFTGGAYVPTVREAETAAPKTARNQLSAVRVEDRIFLSTATGKDMTRSGGVIHVFRLTAEAMILEKTIPITEGFYAYSAIAALPDGGLGLLYESGGSRIRYIRVSGQT
ncbi:MAG: exo-alpha-sialidase, partial [Clostridia bacterium]|nr:exo-alpha-sialidase [Clostridia bacterium]